MVDSQDPSNQQLLDETALKAELATLVAHNQLSSRVAQKLGEKIQDKHLSLTKTQLHHLADRLQTILAAVPAPPADPRQHNPTMQTSSQDMKRLYDEVAELRNRLQSLELTTLDTRTTARPTSMRITNTRDLEKEAIQPLNTIPSDAESIVVVMKWLSFMVERIGKPHIPDVLGYYVDIGWISDDVRLDLLNYAKGITNDTTPIASTKDTNHLPTKDHLQSLLFIQKLKGVHLDDRFLNRIDRDMEKLTKSLEDRAQETRL
jgi:archaellum component FlaD/FlaE